MEKKWLKEFIIQSELIHHHSLSAKDKFVIVRYLQEEKSISEIAKLANVNQDEIQKQLNNAFNKCKFIVFDLLLKKKKLKQVVTENQFLKGNVQDDSMDIGRIIDSENILLSVRAENALLQLGISRLEDLGGFTKSDLLGIKNLGKKTLSEIVDKMMEFGVTFRK